MGQQNSALQHATGGRIARAGAGFRCGCHPSMHTDQGGTPNGAWGGHTGSWSYAHQAGQSR